MEERNSDAKAFWRELEEDGKVDLIFEHVQNILLSFKEKIKDGSATDQEYIHAMNLVNEAVKSNILQLKKDDDITDIESEQESKSSILSPTLYVDFNPKETLIFRVKEIAVSNFEEKILSLRQSYQNHSCRDTCLPQIPLPDTVENPLMMPILSCFQRRHAKTNSNCATFHVNYKTPCGRNLRNFKEVHRYLLETECRFLFLQYFSFNTYVQLNRNMLKKQVFVSESDISHGTEPVPVTFCNEIDNRRLPYFKYLRRMWPRAFYLYNLSNLFSSSCDCSKSCIDVKKCTCLQLTAEGYKKSSTLSSIKPSHGYTYKRLRQPVPHGIFECSFLCKCDPKTCQNRVVQQGLQVRLQVFKTEKKGWGVRCLDDIDKGTFICTYSGRLLSRIDQIETESIDEKEKEEEDTATNDNASPALSKKRRTEAACSESKIDFVQSKEGRTETESLIEYSSSAPRRPKTKTVHHQHFQEKDRIITLESSLSSDEGEPTKVQSTPNTKRESSYPDENPEDKPLAKCTILDNYQCKEEILVENVGKQVVSVCDKSKIKECRVQKQDSQEKRTLERQNQETLCVEKSLSATQGNVSESKNLHDDTSLYLVDATREGNVGRFLNHSCNPNLFVQNVFVETHNRNFPWVAFFTKRHVRAGTELTWDYGYEAGSLPDKEIPCQCGYHTCRKKTL